MPSKSIAQQHLMQAASHGATFPMAKKLRKTMSHKQLRDFSVGSEAGKPKHVSKTPLLKGNSKGIMHVNTATMMHAGSSELDATKNAIKLAHPNRAKNLGKFHHPKKDVD